MYEASKLNVVKKTRSNPFTWRGQFTPELIEYFLDVHSEPDFLIGDPFSGSGTVLFESLRKNLDVVGLEVNPSAYAMSKFFELSMLTFPERWNLCQEIIRNIPLSGLQVNRPLYQKLEKTNYRESYENLINFARKAIDAHTNKIQLVLILNILFKMEGYRKLNIGQAWHKAYNKVSNFLFSLPEISANISAILADARTIHKQINRKIDLIITSPPYINVFNYHQNHRIIMELLDFDILRVAHSEFGSNRKNRGNRFLTVIQYCLDMTQALSAMRKSMSESGKLIMIIGRESNVKKTPFFNGKIISDLCINTGLFKIEDISERCFGNKFGTKIYEDILTMSPGGHCDNIEEKSREVALSHLKKAINNAPRESIGDLEKAIDSVKRIEPSPLYEYRGTK